ncbi:MAG: beta-N-acetylhexosaminidase [Rhodocyclales bacterium]|nr:beta-N-acetylhexosaminidase [Rhodocyclales bacterium]
MIDIAGKALSDLDRQRLRQPLVGGVILFSRNYETPAQLAALCDEIHALREPRLPIAVDHEGGRVQRFRAGFTRLPAMRGLGAWWEKEPQAATEAARAIGFVLAAELRARGVDFSFTPVLDLDWGRSGVIGDRAFHRDPDAVAALAGALNDGLHAAGMACCGKHFPGHGWAEADSHVAIPEDERSLDQMAPDLAPYRALTLGFDGVIFSDDLSMEGASVAGDIVARAEAAWGAGCDMLLVCNAPDAVGALLARWQPQADAARAARVARLLPRAKALAWDELQDQPAYLDGLAAIRHLSA